eukprot:scaffold1484_cov241-Pinguiococcus_pyrenoidosus.AAC.20
MEMRRNSVECDAGATSSAARRRPDAERRCHVDERHQQLTEGEADVVETDGQRHRPLLMSWRYSAFDAAGIQCRCAQDFMVQFARRSCRGRKVLSTHLKETVLSALEDIWGDVGEQWLLVHEKRDSRRRHGVVHHQFESSVSGGGEPRNRTRIAGCISRRHHRADDPAGPELAKGHGVTLRMGANANFHVHHDASRARHRGHLRNNAQDLHWTKHFHGNGHHARTRSDAKGSLAGSD